MAASIDPLLQELVELSRRFGADSTLVLAGGGNTSAKTSERLFVKASGESLANIDAGGFVELERPRLEELAAAELDPDPGRREEAFKKAIHAARADPARGQRPSVECLLHHLLPGRFVLHCHATLANALGCSIGGAALAAELFGDELLWVPYVDPGFALAKALQGALAAHREGTGRDAPEAILLANHGLIVQGEDGRQISARLERTLARIAGRLGAGWRREAFGPVQRRGDGGALIEVIAPALRALAASSDEVLAAVCCDDSDLALSLAGAKRGAQVAGGGPLSPDQIVYCGSFPLWFEPPAGAGEGELIEALRTALDAHEQSHGAPPGIVLVAGLGLFALGADRAGADQARALYRDAIAVMAGAQRLGGIRYLEPARRRFIEEWEVEAYRRQVAAGPGAGGRAAGRIALVTGAAQGFGLEIARALAAEGGQVLLADCNGAGAQAAAAELCDEHGPGRALALEVDVRDPDSVAAALGEVVRACGGLDLLVSNAGVLRAGALSEQPPEEFRFVTEVNYLGYFHCARAVAPIMARQHRARPGWRGDIVQINSKSGLAGSNRNSAYAGSKFGGIGLTQSFALELVADGIKVNSICPGNFFDGPLWSDPEQGLFVQYLRAGKVPGARTVADVRRAYEAKVPMGRGCRAADVMKALFYLIEQDYETGQALPVTGGQVMLR